MKNNIRIVTLGCYIRIDTLGHYIRIVTLGVYIKNIKIKRNKNRNKKNNERIIKNI